MSTSIDHKYFGNLAKETEEEGIVSFTGEFTIADGEPFEVHITGEESESDEEILNKAQAAHEIFVSRVNELRKAGVDQVISDEVLADIVEDSGEELTREDLYKAYEIIMVANYFTECDEVSIYFEDDGLGGVDVNLVTDFTFSKLSVQGDG